MKSYYHMCMQATHISATALARSLSDVLNRVKYRGEEFVIERGGEVIARLTAATAWRDLTAADLVRLVGDIPVPADGFADDLEALRAAQGEVRDPWPS